MRRSSLLLRECGRSPKGEREEYRGKKRRQQEEGTPTAAVAMQH
jgi:hypothetical protein